MIQIGDVIDNGTICDLFGVANTGGIRVCIDRNLIVLISNNTDPLYRNEWKGDVLHFVGRGATGPQRIDRQNKTLANSSKSGSTLHLFEVFEKTKYVYAGQVELAGDEYMGEQTDARTDKRFVWIFPLRRKSPAENVGIGRIRSTDKPNHLPHGAYAVIGSEFREDQLQLINDVIDELKRKGIPVFDKRDVDRKRYEKELVRWHDGVLDHARLAVRKLIVQAKQAAKARGNVLIDGELEISAGSTEEDLRVALEFLGSEDKAGVEALFENARQSIPMPDLPTSLVSEQTVDSIEDLERAIADRKSIEPKTIGDFT